MLNRRSWLGMLAGMPFVAAAALAEEKPKFKEGIILRSEFATTYRPVMNIEGLETDFLEAGVSDRVPYETLAVVMDGKFVERCVYANCRTGEVHTFAEVPADMHPLASPLKRVDYASRSVQILFTSKKERERYMVGHKPYGLPLSNGTSNSPVRQMLEAKFGNE